jgi:hypothetical protein
VPAPPIWVVRPKSAVVSNKETITQASHGLSVGNNIRSAPSGYVKAEANSAANAKGLCGRVAEIIDTNTFVIQYSGLYGTGFIAGAEYWLSATVPGGDQTTAPTLTGQVQAPVGVGTPSGQLQILIQGGQINP